METNVKLWQRLRRDFSFKKDNNYTARLLFNWIIRNYEPIPEELKKEIKKIDKLALNATQEIVDSNWHV